MSCVLVFGTFDHLHPGHQDLFRQAKDVAQQLIVCVAPDAIVERLKGRLPDQPLAVRMQAVARQPMVSQVIAGDTELGNYGCVRALQPEVIAFGYDQERLAQDFQRFQQQTGDTTPTIVLKPYQPEVYKSSLRRPASQ